MRPRHRQPVIAVAGWAVLVLVSIVWGQELLPSGRLNVHSPPFQGLYRLSVPAVIAPSLFGAVAVTVLPRIAAALRWRPLLLVSWLLGCCWAAVLNAWDGHPSPSLGSPLARGNEYLVALPLVGDHPLSWLRGFIAHIAEQPLHVRGHPPLMVLVLWALDRVGLGGEIWAGLLVITVGASSIAAVAVTVRALAGEVAARDALPFLVLAPFAITVATSADSFFAGVAAWAVALVCLGIREGRPTLLAAGGLLTGALPYLNYALLAHGAVLLAAATLAVLAQRHRNVRQPKPGLLLAAALAGLAVLPVLMTLGGFWWPDGVAATHGQWAAGKGDDRPYGYSFVADLAVLAVLVGPATAAGAASRPSRPVAMLAVSSLVAVLALDASGVTRLEVERIWLPFAPWLMVATAGLRSHRRRWLALNVLVALAFQLLVLDGW